MRGTFRGPCSRCRGTTRARRAEQPFECRVRCAEGMDWCDEAWRCKSQCRSRIHGSPIERSDEARAQRWSAEYAGRAQERRLFADEEGREAQREPGNRQGRVTGALLVAA